MKEQERTIAQRLAFTKTVATALVGKLAGNLLPMEKRIVCPVSAPTLAPYAAAVVAATVATSIELIPAIPALRDVVLVPGRCEQHRRHTSVIEPNIKEHVYDWAKCLILYNAGDKEI